jgi:hypothetical protein
LILIQSTLMSTDAMYYPHIHFRSREWLRSALFYYDRITRIVPKGIEPDTVDEYSQFSPDAEALSYEVRELTAAGFIRNQAPDQMSVSETADDFLAFASNSLTDPSRRESIFRSLNRRNPWLSVHPSKIDPGLLAIFNELDLAHKNASDRYGDWDIDAATGLLYLMYLANRMSAGRPLVTDNPRYQKLLYSYATNSNNPPLEKPDGAFLLVAAAFESIIPSNLKDVPLRDLLKFRDNHCAERDRFANRIRSLAKDISAAKDDYELNLALNAQIAAIAEEKNVLQDKLRSNNLAFATGLFTVSVPSYILSVASHHPLVIAGAAIAAISSTLFKFALERKITLQSSPYTYLLDVERFLSPRRLASSLVTLNNIDDYDPDNRPAACSG